MHINIQRFLSNTNLEDKFSSKEIITDAVHIFRCAPFYIPEPACIYSCSSK